MHTFKIFKKWLYFEPYGLSSTPTSQDAQFHLKNTIKFFHYTSPCCIHTLGLTMISMCRVLSSTTRLMASRLIHKLLVLKILWKNNRLYMKNCCLMLVEGWWLCYDCMTGYLLKFADTFKFIYLKAESNSFNSYKQLCTVQTTNYFIKNPLNCYIQLSLFYMCTMYLWYSKEHDQFQPKPLHNKEI